MKKELHLIEMVDLIGQKADTLRKKNNQDDHSEIENLLETELRGNHSEIDQREVLVLTDERENPLAKERVSEIDLNEVRENHSEIDQKESLLAKEKHLAISQREVLINLSLIEKKEDL